MASDIKPGQWINVKVTARPTSAAHVKTMHRLFEKDPTLKTERKRLSRARPVTTHIRGGRPWPDHPPRVKIVKTEPGAQYRIFGSVDVLKELGSLDRFVEITPA